MSVYLRLLIRLSILAILVFGLSVLTSTPAQAFSCLTDCYVAKQNCLAQCNSLPHKPVEGCAQFCGDPYAQCVSGCLM
jgi:hypothetical protein